MIGSRWERMSSGLADDLETRAVDNVVCYGFVAARLCRIGKDPDQATFQICRKILWFIDLCFTVAQSVETMWFVLMEQS